VLSPRTKIVVVVLFLALLILTLTVVATRYGDSSIAYQCGRLYAGARNANDSAQVDQKRLTAVGPPVRGQGGVACGTLRGLGRVP
jgi:hypothetical protein